MKSGRGLFAERAAMQFRRFGPANYVQFDLAWGLALHACGRDEDGRERLRRFCATYGASMEERTLARAIADAQKCAHSLE